MKKETDDVYKELAETALLILKGWAIGTLLGFVIVVAFLVAAFAKPAAADAIRLWNLAAERDALRAELAKKEDDT